MKHLLIVVPVLILIFSCNPSDHENIFVRNKLVEIDNMIYEKSQDAIDSLNKLKISNFSASNIAYYHLLYTIATYESCRTFDYDSSIAVSLKWYEKKNEKYNYCRSIFYKGIALYNKNKSDPIACSSFMLSEKLYKNCNMNDKILQSRIYLYLGRINRAKHNFNEAQKFFINSRDISVRLKRINDEQIVRLDLFWTFLAQKRYKDALENIIQFEESEISSPEIQYNLYDALAGYYSAKKEFDMSAVYVRKMVRLKEKKSLKIDKSKLYYTLSSYYKRSGVPDSALYYSKLAVSSISDSLSTENHFYYKYLGEIYASKGDYINAFENYKNAYEKYIFAYSKITSNKVLEIEKKYDSSQLENRLSTNKRYKTLFLVCTVLLLCISSVTIAMLISKLYFYKKRAIIAEKQNKCNERDANKLWLVNELLVIPAELLTEFTDNVNMQASKNRKISKEFSDCLERSIDSIKAKFKYKMSFIANNDRLLKDIPDLKYIPGLSDLEKLIFVLKNYGYSSQDIATFLGSSSPRIRAMRAKLKEKLSANKYLET